MDTQTIPDQFFVVISKKELRAHLWATKFLKVTNKRGPRFKYWPINSQLKALAPPITVPWTNESPELKDHLQDTLGADYVVLRYDQTLNAAWAAYDIGKIQ